jgi:hypothetical protein
VDTLPSIQRAAARDTPETVKIIQQSWPFVGDGSALVSEGGWIKRLPKGETAMSTLSMLKFRVSIFTAVLAFAPLSPASHAQSAGAFAKVNVPFAFETASGHYPAGVYTLRMETPSVLMIRGVSDAGLVMMTAVEDNGQRVKSGVAVFHRYGNRYFLREISATGESRRLHLQPSKAEKQMQIAASKTAPASLEVALIETAH